MAPKRKLDEADLESSTAIPPSLPPSVEEAYRRKCVQLKNRTNEVEEANDAARLRLSRIKRQVEKLRIERAFLLEQLSKRTSTNVEDSEGSPSPPPTVRHLELPPTIRAGDNRANRTTKPQDKPLRIKRGHRKVSTIPEVGEPKPATTARGKRGSKAAANGVRAPKKKGRTAFDFYSEDTRPGLEAKHADDEDVNIDDELTKGWLKMDDTDKDEYEKKAAEAAEAAEAADAADAAKEEEEDKDEKEEDGDGDGDVDVDGDGDIDVDGDGDADKKGKDDADDDDEDDEDNDKGDDADKTEAQDEDVEMANYDSDQETQMDKDGDE